MAEKQRFAEVISELRKQKNLTQQEVADQIGVTKSAVYGFEKGRSFPVPDKLVTLSRYFGVTVDYLLTGENGTMYLFEAKNYSSDASDQKKSSYMTPTGAIKTVAGKDLDPAASSSGFLHAAAAKLPDEAYAAEPKLGYEPRLYVPDMAEATPAPLYNLRTAASYMGAGHSQEVPEPDGVITLPNWLLKQGNHAVFPVIGDSMEPTFFAGDYVLCRFVPRGEWSHFRAGNVAVIVSESRGLQLKRLTLRTGENLVRCKSDNRTHRAYNLPLDGDVLEIWRFEWRITANASNIAETMNERMEKLEETQDDMRHLLEQMMDAKELQRIEARRTKSSE